MVQNLLRKLFVTMLAVAMIIPAMAINGSENESEAESASETVRLSTIRGRVVGSDKQVLAGAVVYVADQNTGTTSDADGYYIITGVKPGQHEIVVHYVGYMELDEQVTVAEGVTVDYNIELNAGIEVGAVVVSSVMQGQHRAVNSQKNALSMMDIVAADQVGKYPDSNIGDALKRISGINVQYDQGEARFGQVRGTPADMSSVTINGNRVPSAEGETRNVQLDLIPSDMIQTIEVSKVVTPDMDADAIGGSINLITKSSPTSRMFNMTLGSGYSVVSERPQLNGGFTYGDLFADGKLGMMLSASYQNNPLGSDNTEFEWDKDDEGNSILKEAQIRQYYVERERQSYSASLNYNFNPNHKVTFKGIYNRRNDWENRYKTKIKDLDEDKQKIGIETKGGTPDNKLGRLELQQTMDLALSGEHVFNSLLMDWNTSWSRASEDRPNERYIAFEDKRELLVDLENMRQPTITPVNEDESFTLDRNYELDELSESNQNIYETDFKASMNFELPLSAKGLYESSLKFGGKYVTKSKHVEHSKLEYKDAIKDVDSFLDAAFATVQNQDRPGFMPGEQYNVGRKFVSKEFLGNLDFNSSDFNPADVEKVLEESAGDFNATEQVASAYLRYDQKLGEKVDMMAGVRVEHTMVEYDGKRFIAEDENNNGDPSIIDLDKKNRSYTNYLPSIMFKYDANRDLKVRLSFTNTLARPKYSDLVPKFELNEDNELKLGNPDLQAALSYNADLSADYYFESIGLVRAGVFYKKINNFIVDQRTSIYDDVTYDEVKTPINGGNADLLGAEFSYQRDFGFIAPALRCVGFSGTYTYTHSSVSDFNVKGREDEKLALPGSPEHTANASIYFEKAGFTARVSFNYASEFIDELGKNAFEYRYYDSVNYLDLNLNYSFDNKYIIYADVTNLMNQPLRYYQGVKDQTMQVEYYGMRFAAGLKINF